MSATNVPSLQNDSKKMDSFCREGIGQLYKMEGAKVTDCYKMGRGLERPTHLVVKMNAHENHQQKSRIVKTVFLTRFWTPVKWLYSPRSLGLMAIL